MLKSISRVLAILLLTAAGNISAACAQGGPDTTVTEEEPGIEAILAEKNKYEKLVWNLDTTNPETYYPNNIGKNAGRGEYCFVLDATASIDPMRPDLVYEWELGGTRKIYGTKTTACFPDPGAHIIWLNVLDTVTNTADLQVVWLDPFSEPDLAFNHGGNYLIGSTIRFDGTKYLSAGQMQTGSWTKGIADVNQMEEFEKNERMLQFRTSSLVWDFGNGIIRVGPKSNHVWHEPGKYKVVLSVVQEGDKGLEVIQSCFETISILPNR